MISTARYVLLSLAAWLISSASARANAPAEWEPAKTRAFVVCLARFQNDSVPSFSTDDRLDDRFVALFEQRGVPRGQIVFLKDGQATSRSIQNEFSRLLRQSKPDELLLFYFGSHGQYDPKTGRCRFISFDGSLPFEWAFEAIEQQFKGSRALLTADCCHSGGIVEMAGRRRSKIAYACLSSTYTHQTAWSGWRFLECLIRGFEGNPIVDQADRGYVDLESLASYTERYMAFAAEGKPEFTTTHGFDPRLRLAKTDTGSARPDRQVGKLVEIASAGSWSRGEILEVQGNRLRIHYTKDTRSDDDQWVAADRVRSPVYPRYAVGTKVELQGASNREWYPGVVLDHWESLHFGRYDGYGPEYDEWFGPSRIRPALDGSWVGRWQNETGQQGRDTLILTPDDGRGFLTGTWSGDLPVSVERLSNELFLLEAQSGDRSYLAAGRLEGQRLLLDYAARGASETYLGWSVFQRAGEENAIRSPRAEFAGKWAGTYRNSTGGAGDDVLELVETQGTLQGRWSGLAITGQRLGNNTLYLTGKRGDMTYRVVGCVDRGELVLGYSATSKTTRYTGQAMLKQ
jgi:hypothetical protein